MVLHDLVADNKSVSAFLNEKDSQYTGYLDTILDKMLNEKPSMIYNNFLKSKLLSQYAVDMCTDICPVLSKHKSILVGTYHGFDLLRYNLTPDNKKLYFDKLKKTRLCNYHFNRNQYQLSVYSRIELFVAVFGKEYLCDSIILYYAIHNLFNIYRYFKKDDSGHKNIFIFDIKKEIELCISSMNNMSVESIEDNIMNHFSTEPRKKSSRIKISKPKTKEELIEIYRWYAHVNEIEDYTTLTQTEKKVAIMNRLNCGDRTARQIMNECGDTKLKYTRHTYLDEVREEVKKNPELIVDYTRDLTDEINENTWMVCEDIKNYIDVIFDKRFNNS